MEKSTRDCFNQLVSSLGQGDKAVLVSVVSQLFGVSEETVTDWTKNVFFPNGLNLIKTQALLELLRFELAETKGLSPSAIYLRFLLSYGVYTPEQIGEILGVNAQSILRLAKGNSGTTDARAGKLLAVFRSQAEALEWNMRVWKRNLAFLRSFPGSAILFQDGAILFQDGFMPKQQTDNPIPLKPEVSMSSATHKDLVLSLLAMQLIQILPLATRVASDEFSAADRDCLRKLVGSDTVFQLKNELVRLCGERARDLANKEGIRDDK